MTLHQLKVFLTIVKLNGVANAAEALYISQPSVSGVIQDLQNELGVKLFERLGNKRHLTEAGKRLFQRAESAISVIDGIQDEMEEMKGLKKGKITVGGSALAAAAFLVQAVQEFKKRHSNIEVLLKIDRSKILMKNLLEGGLDLAVLGRPASSPLIVAEPYRDEEIVTIAPANHPLASKREVPLEILARQPLVAQHKNDRLRDIVEQRFAEKGLPFAPILEVESEVGGRDIIRTAVTNGIGIGFIAKCHVVSDLDARKLRLLRVPDLDLKSPIYIAYHKKRENFPLTQAFREFLGRYKR